jgi:hypothetical protein
MSSEERRKILQMVEDGKITAAQAVTLMKALEEDEPEAQISPLETEAGAGSVSEPDPGLAATAEKARSLWQIPLWLGVGLTVLSAVLIYWIMSSSGYNFWFYCMWLPLLAGVALTALAAASRTMRWLFVRVDQKPGEYPQKIILGFPLPLRLAGWFLRTFGHKIPSLHKTNADEILQVLDAAGAAGAPLIVNVEDEEDGERVQVFIG